MKHNHSVRTVTIALLGVMTIPVATQHLLQGQIVRSEGEYAIFRSQDDEGFYSEGEDIREDVKAYQGTTFRAKRRAYSRAVERCRDRMRTEKGVVCPDINDSDSFDFKEPGLPDVQSRETGTGAVRPAAASTGLPERELTTAERELLRTNTRAGFCKTSLGEYLYDLCLSLVGKKSGKEAPVGFINDNVKLHSTHAAPPSTLKLRLRMLDEAISGSRGRRTGVQGPLRYEGGLND